MKKSNLLLLLTFIAVSYSALACSFALVSFCYTTSITSDELVVSGKIIHMDEDGLDLQILSVLKGEESRDIIRVWDGTDFDCNGPFSMAAFNLGDLNDSIIIILPLIDSLENSWEVMGDFRVPTLYGATSFLKIENNTVRGAISGVGAEYLNSLAYADFLAQWAANMNNCSTWVGTDAIQDEEAVLWYTNPVQSVCTIQFQQESITEKILEVYSYDGRRLQTMVSKQATISIDLAPFSNGLYFIKIRDNEGRQSVVKVMKS